MSDKDVKHKVVIKIKCATGDDDEQNVNSISIPGNGDNDLRIKDCQAAKKERVLIQKTIDRLIFEI